MPLSLHHSAFFISCTQGDKARCFQTQSFSEYICVTYTHPHTWSSAVCVCLCLMWNCSSCSHFQCQTDVERWQILTAKNFLVLGLHSSKNIQAVDDMSIEASLVHLELCFRPALFFILRGCEVSGVLSTDPARSEDRIWWGHPCCALPSTCEEEGEEMHHVLRRKHYYNTTLHHHKQQPLLLREDEKEN